MGRIVIADDTAVVRKILRLIFERRGDTVEAEVENGQEAIIAFKTHQPDLMTLDINMPVKSGIEAVREIKRNFPVDNILMISSYSERSLLMQAFQNGIRHFILKPFSEEKLLSVVDQILGSSKDAAQTVGNTLSSEAIEEKPIPQSSQAPKEIQMTHKAFVNGYLAGKTVGENIYNSQGKLLLKEGNVITSAMIDHLKKNNVCYIEIT